MRLAFPATLAALALACSPIAAQAKHRHHMAAPAAAPAEPVFYATPMNAMAPTNLPGETIIPGMALAMTAVNAVTQPILQPLLAPGGAPPAAAPAPGPMHHHHHHHHHVM